MIDIPQHILERAADGDLEAFEEVYKLTGGFVYNVALRVTRRAEDAEEVTQDVFLKIYRSLKDFQFRSAFRTWVYRITVNTAINHCRRSSGTENFRVDYDSFAEVIPDAGSTADQAMQKDAQAQLQGLLGLLSPEHRACLVLREIEGLSYHQIAVSLKIPVNTVRSRLKRAREALMEAARKGLVRDEL